MRATSLSVATTSWPASARQLPETNPTYPHPITASFTPDFLFAGVYCFRFARKYSHLIVHSREVQKQWPSCLRDTYWKSRGPWSSGLELLRELFIRRVFFAIQTKETSHWMNRVLGIFKHCIFHELANDVPRKYVAFLDPRSFLGPNLNGAFRYILNFSAGFARER